MAKYKCILCNYIYDEIMESKTFNLLDNTWTCPKCGEKKDSFKKLNYETFPKDIKLYNAIVIREDNPSIERLIDKCIDCGLCSEACQNIECIANIDDGNNCVHCGNCIKACPVGALRTKSHIDKVKEAIKKEITVAYIAPASRVILGEYFNMPEGTNVEGKLITVLKKLGINYVFDVAMGADMTVIEEANELARRIKNDGILPMFTSCCPSWVSYVNNFYPSLSKNLSTCKSPIGMIDSLTKSYYQDIMGIDKIYSIAIVPCTSKKAEDNNVDTTLTVSELADYITAEEIVFELLEDSNYDKLLSESSSGGVKFGVSGGVLDSTFKTAYKILSGDDYTSNLGARMNNGIKEVILDINGFKLKGAIVSGIANLNKIIDLIDKGKCDYHLIEVMNCEGGCVNGAGAKVSKDYSKRRKYLCVIGYDRNNKLAYKNPDAIKIYKDFLEKPGSIEAEELLHKED